MKLGLIATVLSLRVGRNFIFYFIVRLYLSFIVSRTSEGSTVGISRRTTKARFELTSDGSLNANATNVARILGETRGAENADATGHWRICPVTSLLSIRGVNRWSPVG